MTRHSRPLTDTALTKFLDEFHNVSATGFGTDLSYQARAIEA